MAQRNQYTVPGIVCMGDFLSTYGPYLCGQSVAANIDNESIVYVLNSGRSKETKIMALVRAVYMYTTMYHITYKAFHLSTHANFLADALSRNEISLYKSMLPECDECMTIPIDPKIDF